MPAGLRKLILEQVNAPPSFGEKAVHQSLLSFAFISSDCSIFQNQIFSRNRSSKILWKNQLSEHRILTMNTIRSTFYGWGVLILAGGGSYYFAKKQINKDRDERAASIEKSRQQAERLRAQEQVARDRAMSANSPASATSGAVPVSGDHPSPSVEATTDPAPTKHVEKESRFEAKEPFRSRKGDRFS
ncbi:unnamed protein product [Cercospora beticola]|nr:unnamed protein product [Cercospora beticola]